MTERGGQRSKWLRALGWFCGARSCKDGLVSRGAEGRVYGGVIGARLGGGRYSGLSFRSSGLIGKIIHYGLSPLNFFPDPSIEAGVMVQVQLNVDSFPLYANILEWACLFLIIYIDRLVIIYPIKQSGHW